VSLILEALKKIEREKDVAARGFSVHAATPWPSRHRGPLGLVVGGLLLVAAGVAAGFYVRTGTTPAERSAAGASASTAVPPASTAVAASAPPAYVPGPPPSAPAVTRSALPPTPARDAAPAPPAPAPTTAPAERPLRLQAISAQDGRPVAVVNEQVVHEGDTVDGARVLRIGPGEVEVEVLGRRRTLTF
jgi:hypothetical protein